MSDEVKDVMFLKELFLKKLFGDATNNNRIELQDGLQLILGTSSGLKIGTGATQKIGFYSKTPIVQPTTGVAESVFVENVGGTAVNVDSTFDGYTIQQIVKALRNMGVLG